MRRVVAGNWKMNNGPAETARFFDAFELEGGEGAPRVMVFPPALSFHAAAEAARGTGVEVGVQNVHQASSGAFTGEVSAEMALEAGATLTLVGHSERRHIFGETDDTVGRKTAHAADVGLVPVVCVGETLEERRAGALEAVLTRQLDAVLDLLPDGAEWILAYEPVWAIGTGETATPADASEAHEILGARLEERGWSRDTVPILYGGSVKPGNAAELMDAPGVDGVLVGGASLDPESFAAIVEAGRR